MQKKKVARKKKQTRKITVVRLQGGVSNIVSEVARFTGVPIEDVVAVLIALGVAGEAAKTVIAARKEK